MKNHGIEIDQFHRSGKIRNPDRFKNDFKSLMDDLKNEMEKIDSSESIKYSEFFNKIINGFKSMNGNIDFWIDYI
jgi:hypothetical protein